VPSISLNDYLSDDTGGVAIDPNDYLSDDAPQQADAPLGGYLDQLKRTGELIVSPFTKDKTAIKQFSEGNKRILDAGEPTVNPGYAPYEGALSGITEAGGAINNILARREQFQRDHPVLGSALGAVTGFTAPNEPTFTKDDVETPAITGNGVAPQVLRGVGQFATQLPAFLATAPAAGAGMVARGVGMAAGGALASRHGQTLGGAASNALFGLAMPYADKIVERVAPELPWLAKDLASRGIVGAGTGAVTAAEGGSPQDVVASGLTMATIHSPHFDKPGEITTPGPLTPEAQPPPIPQPDRPRMFWETDAGVFKRDPGQGVEDLTPLYRNYQNQLADYRIAKSREPQPISDLTGRNPNELVNPNDTTPSPNVINLDAPESGTPQVPEVGQIETQKPNVPKIEPVDLSGDWYHATDAEGVLTLNPNPGVYGHGVYLSTLDGVSPYGRNVLKTSHSVKNPYVIPGGMHSEIRNGIEDGILDSEEVSKDLISKGYDGIYVQPTRIEPPILISFSGVPIKEEGTVINDAQSNPKENRDEGNAGLLVPQPEVPLPTEKGGGLTNLAAQAALDEAKGVESNGIRNGKEEGQTQVTPELGAGDSLPPESPLAQSDYESAKAQHDAEYSAGLASKPFDEKVADLKAAGGTSKDVQDLVDLYSRNEEPTPLNDDVPPMDEETAQMKPLPFKVKRAPKPMKGWMGGNKGAAIVPGAKAAEVVGEQAKNFYTDDLKPLASSIGEIPKTFGQGIVGRIGPRSTVAPRAVDAIMTRAGDVEQGLYVARQEQRPYKEMVQKLNPIERSRLLERHETADYNGMTPEQVETSDIVKAQNKRAYELDKKWFPDMGEIPNYLIHMYKDMRPNEAARIESRMRLKGAKPGKDRVFETYREAGTVDNPRTGKPYEPITDNILELSKIRLKSALKNDATFNMIKDLDNLGFGKKLGKDETVPEGWKLIDDPTFDPTRTHYFEPNAARVINNFISHDKIQESKALNTLKRAKMLYTAAELSLSAFHGVAMTMEAASTAIGHDLVKGNLTPTLPWNALKAPVEMAREGSAWQKAIVNPEQFFKTDMGQKLIAKYPEARQAIDLFFAGGGRIGMHEDYKANMNEAMKEAFARNNKVGGTLRYPVAKMEQLQGLLFEKYIPMLKLSGFMREMSIELKRSSQQIADGKTTPKQIAREVVDRMDNRFGELNYDTLFWNRTFKSAMQMAFRSVTWKMGNIRGLGEGLISQGKNVANAARGKEPLRLEQGAAWLLGMAISNAVVGGMTQWAMTGKLPEEPVDFAFPKIGGEDEKGKPIRVSVPGYLRDYFQFAKSPTAYAQHGLSGMVMHTLDAWNNKDFYGRQVYDPTVLNRETLKRGDVLPWMKQAGKIAAHVTTPIPFAVSGMMRMREENASAPRQALNFLGMTQASNTIDQTPDEKFMAEISAQNQSAVGMPDEQWQKKQTRNKARSALRQGNVLPLKEAYKSGKLGESDVKRMIGDVRLTPQESQFKSLPINYAMKAFELADKERKKKYLPLLLNKLDNIKNLPREEQEAIIPKLKQLFADYKQASAQ